MTDVKFRPLHDRVVVRRVESEEKTAGGIIIPDTAKEKPSEGEIVAVGSGGNYASSAARALLDYEPDPEIITRKAMAIAAEICIYTNENLTIETLTAE